MTFYLTKNTLVKRSSYVLALSSLFLASCSSGTSSSGQSSITITPSSASVEAESSIDLTVKLSAQPTSAVTVNLTESSVPKGSISFPVKSSCEIESTNANSSCTIKVQGDKAGIATVTAGATGYESASSTITVEPKLLRVTGVTWLTTETTTGVLTAVLPKNVTSAVPVTFTVESSGTTNGFALTGTTPGTATCTIQATKNSCEIDTVNAGTGIGKAVVSVNAGPAYESAVTSVEVSPSQVITMNNPLNIVTGANGTLTATLPALPSGASEKNVGVAFTVESGGTGVTLNSKTCTIAAKLNSTASCTITVTAGEKLGYATVTAKAEGYSIAQTLVVVQPAPAAASKK